MIFNLGQTLATPSVLSKVSEDEIVQALERYVKGDWGETVPEDADLNNEAIQTKDRILASYKTKDGITFWIITDSGHEVTTILLPSEY